MAKQTEKTMWLMNEEGQRMSDFINSVLMFFACCIFIGGGMMVLMLFRPEIQSAIRYVQGLIF